MKKYIFISFEKSETKSHMVIFLRNKAFKIFLIKKFSFNLINKEVFLDPTYLLIHFL